MKAAILIASTVAGMNLIQSVCGTYIALTIGLAIFTFCIGAMWGAGYQEYKCRECRETMDMLMGRSK